MIGKFIPFWAAFLVAAIPATAEQKVTHLDRFELWNECRPTNLGIETLHDSAKNIGLTEEEIKITVRSQLRAARLYTTDIDKTTASLLYVNINIEEHAFNIKVNYYKTMTDEATGLSDYAARWTRGSVGTHGGNSHFILGSLATHVDGFIDEYLRVNADSCGPPTASSGRDESHRDCPHCPEMVMIPAGAFMMGSLGSDAGHHESEGPLHQVTISRPFAVGKYEVTNEEYAAFVQANPTFRYPETYGDNKHPVVDVSWHEAKAYAAWLFKETGREYRLLSESEWEYVARAGTLTAYNWGDDIGIANAHCASCGTHRGGEKTVPVGSFAANGFGLHDMHGNVWEWVEDCWNSSYDGAPSDGQAWLSGNCDKHVIRGGSWLDAIPLSLRSAFRFGADEGRYIDIGFRVARTN